MICFAIAIMPGVCFGITATGLQNLLKEGEALAIIDIRGRSDFAAGHIPNAMNIHAPVIKYKQLPPMGKVIVCGDGISVEAAIEAARALNQKAGINAEILEGGFPSWVALKFPSTQKVGIARQMFRYITYEKLREAAKQNRGMVLVDMRKSEGLEKGLGSSEPEVLSDLSGDFPGLEIITLAPRALRSRGQAEAVSTAKFFRARENEKGRVFVLIGRGDGRAEKLARHLHGAGITQVVILAGGEMVLQTKGQAGLKTRVVKE